MVVAVIRVLFVEVDGQQDCGAAEEGQGVGFHFLGQNRKANTVTMDGITNIQKYDPRAFMSILE